MVGEDAQPERNQRGSGRLLTLDAAVAHEICADVGERHRLGLPGHALLVEEVYEPGGGTLIAERCARAFEVTSLVGAHLLMTEARALTTGSGIECFQFRCPLFFKRVGPDRRDGDLQTMETTDVQGESRANMQKR